MSTPLGHQAAEIGGLEEKLGTGGVGAGALLPPYLKLGKVSPKFGAAEFRGRRGRGELGKGGRAKARAGSGTRVGSRPGSGPQLAVRCARPGRCPLPPLGAAWLPPPPPPASCLSLLPRYNALPAPGPGLRALPATAATVFTPRAGAAGPNEGLTAPGQGGAWMGIVLWSSLSLPLIGATSLEAGGAFYSAPFLLTWANFSALNDFS